MMSESQLCSPGTENWIGQPRPGICNHPISCAEGSPLTVLPSCQDPIPMSGTVLSFICEVRALHKGAVRGVRELKSSSFCPYAWLLM